MIDVCLWGGGCGEVCVWRQRIWLGPRVEVLGGDGFMGGEGVYGGVNVVKCVYCVKGHG